ncbi:MAG: hypothetical protein EKK37_17910 [Sphingobacteriales bacterium]|nr:MAG: hypothetical protein EKK37_17910 [Sphingobacteriales bacterium]
MGKINKGILGPVSGTVGTVIGGSWKGISYLRSQPTSRRTSFSQAQLEQQAKFALVIRFLQSMTALISVTFRDYAVEMSGFNNAMRYTLINAVTGVYPNFDIAYNLALVSRGDLPGAQNPLAASSAAGVITWQWQDNSGMGRALPTDKSILVAYCPSRNQCIYTVQGAARNTGTDALQVAAFSGLQVQTFIGFISDDGKLVASSIYTGQLTVE